MGFSVGDLFTSSLMFINGLAILSEGRFLAPLGLASTKDAGGGSEERFYFDDAPGRANATKEQIKQVLSSVRTLLRMPLIALNLVTVGFLLVFGCVLG